MKALPTIRQCKFMNVIASLCIYAANLPLIMQVFCTYKYHHILILLSTKPNLRPKISSKGHF